MSPLIPASEVPAAVAIFVVSLGVAAVYVYVGFRIAGRPVSAGSRLASYQLGLWWAGLGASVALGGFELLLALLNAFPFAAAQTTYLVTILVDCVFLWALVGFLTYVYTGRYHLLELSVFYVAFYIAVLYYFFSQDAYAVKFLADQAVFQYTAVPNPVLEVALVIGLLGPEIAGAALYLSLRRRTKDSAQRYRIGLVGGGILLWFALDVFVPATTPAWLLTRTVLELIPGLMSLIAFFPPEWARRRYGVTAVSGPELEPNEVAAQP